MAATQDTAPSVLGPLAGMFSPEARDVIVPDESHDTSIRADTQQAAETTTAIAAAAAAAEPAPATEATEFHSVSHQLCYVGVTIFNLPLQFWHF